MNVPQLRFKGFEGKWKLVSLEDIGEGITAGKSKFNNKYKDVINKIPVLGSTGIIGYSTAAEYNGDW